MLDVLVALLLLAVALTGACVTLIQAMRASGEALRATLAADLAADLTEELHSVADPAVREVVFASWRNKVATVLPVAGMKPEEFASLTTVPPEPVEGVMTPVAPLLHLRLRWHTQGGEIRELGLALAAPTGGPR